MKNQTIHKTALSGVLVGMALAVLMWAPLVQAEVITGATSFNVNWLLESGQNDNDGGAPTQDLSALGQFTVTSLTNTMLTMTVKLTNTTILDTYANAGITAFGLGVDPSATSVSISNAAGDVFQVAILQNGQQTFPGGYKQIDICVVNASPCASGSQTTALAAEGGMDEFVLTIGGNFADGSGGQLVTLDPFPIKFQTSGGSFEFGGAVPEPTSLLLSGLGLAAVAGYAFRRQRKGVQS